MGLGCEPAESGPAHSRVWNRERRFVRVADAKVDLRRRCHHARTRSVLYGKSL